MKILTLLVCIFIVENAHGHPYKLSNKLNYHSASSASDKSARTKRTNSDSGPLIRYQAQEDNGYYKFGYAVADGQYRVEEGSPEEGILGSYGYVDPSGEQVKVFYKADHQGFQILTPDLYKVLTESRKGFGHGNVPPSVSPPDEQPTFFNYPENDKPQPGIDVFHFLTPEIPQNDTNVVIEGTDGFKPADPVEPDIDPNEEVDVIGGPGVSFGYVPQPGFTPNFGGQYPGFGQPAPPPQFPGNQYPFVPPFYYVPQGFLPALRQKYQYRSLSRNHHTPLIIKI